MRSCGQIDKVAGCDTKGCLLLRRRPCSGRQVTGAGLGVDVVVQTGRPATQTHAQRAAKIIRGLDNARFYQHLPDGNVEFADQVLHLNQPGGHVADKDLVGPQIRQNTAARRQNAHATRRVGARTGARTCARETARHISCPGVVQLELLHAHRAQPLQSLLRFDFSFLPGCQLSFGCDL